MRRGIFGISTAVALAVVLAACQQAEPQTTGGTGPNPCNPPPLKTAGQLTVGAELLNYPPFLIGKGVNPPPTGFEADFMNELGRRLRTKIVWKNTSFDSLWAPGPKKWDLGVSQITIGPERAKAVDFSIGYLKADQSLLIRAGTPIERARGIPDLKQFRLGGEAGTTGVDFIKQKIKPDKPISEFDTTSDAAQALKSGTIDAQVIDLPIAWGIMKESKSVRLRILAQFITNESYGLAFEKGSALRTCVNQVIKAMDADGFLRRKQLQWLPGSLPLPIFQ